MNKVMGIINLAEEKNCLSELTTDRCLAAVPFAARYRLIDFALTNMVRSNVKEIAIFTHSNYRSLLTHVGSGADWDLNKRHGGLYVLPPYWQDTDINGDIDYFLHNWDYIERSKAEHLLISGSSLITNTNFDKLIQDHINKNADITFLTIKTPASPALNDTSTFQDNRQKALSTKINNVTESAFYTGIYLIKKSCLHSLIFSSGSEITSNLLIDVICSQFSLMNVQIVQHQGYSCSINSIQDYYHHSLQLLEQKNYEQLFQLSRNVTTKISNYKPAKYEQTASVKQSLISTGCRIAGNVEKSMLSRAVTVEAGATVKNSIILDHCQIKSGAYIENAIIDKFTVLSEGDIIIGDKEHPHVIGKQKNVQTVVKK
ncbi:glucose-1-phosphate adenylyltransferase subunit GlgD [Gracilibacillus oryzae]|uniref:Glucose-1-phosphate adenylyltransferase subunit GlgD n=1 Tax=Gracilibacillus oryzae TaxID=1672701 RepID=A0A7C8L8X5_9BACI|nr:glucose-1-phosphate adenylyltransferase subunit GlgD [Gracilibacillus oryzae]KAB8138538.1 glucose-1-phosphate adenylyltransferase subunit GlgD [Gracilibacillus oryzae]